MSKIQLLQASVDADGPSEFRLLIDDKFIKYLNIDPGIYSVDDMCFEPSLVAMLPPLPTSDWNKGHLSRSVEAGDAVCLHVIKDKMPSITNTWHTRCIDYLDLSLGRKLRSNVYETTCPQFDVPVVAKFARFAWEVAQCDAETRAYQWINGHGIGPVFLAHLSEHGRIIGFLIEKVPGAQHAAPEHLSLCRQTLARLHQLCIIHGDVNKYNFLVHNGKATLIDFDHTQRCEDADMLENELKSLEEKLNESSGRGGILVGRGAI
ncbi:uncharacterized protein K452DRAFT_313963 [Aplosporella prunicola CBS 121167]|uniref:non-specific serine/threonine protein kinase n=1 Tax=Aplosporella prunicola CBS 121167 TaxID=1176127 RepID=A0A6A6AWB6_9PEZI|nr:uncharacterized protein K452DRAFT_313963 [Aplosporella prunicola CBS 121167]KAF2135473.1 hypothetical protein K452DRAFT_313963 [Aplosporella prunicola CBS 121167]